MILLYILLGAFLLVYFLLQGYRFYLYKTEPPKAEEIYLTLSYDEELPSLTLYLTGKNIFRQETHIDCKIIDEYTKKTIFSFSEEHTFVNKALSLVIGNISLKETSKQNTILRVKLEVYEVLTPEQGECYDKFRAEGGDIVFDLRELYMEKFFDVNKNNRSIKKHNFFIRRLLNYIFIFFPQIKEHYFVG